MTHDLLLTVHNLGRWAVLATAAWALVRAWRGYAGGRAWGPADKLSGLAFTTVLNLQFVIGIVLYFNSPLVRPAFADAGYLTGGWAVAFFAVVHPLAMITAAVLAQVVYSVAKRTPGDRRRFRVAALGYTGTVMLVAASIPWPFLGYGRPLWPSGGVTVKWAHWRWWAGGALAAGCLAWLAVRRGPEATPTAADGRGAELFRSHCASCHGPAGRGDGRSAAGLRPPPRDFAAADWRFERTRGSVLRVVAEGIPGTAMPSHRAALSDEELGLLADHVMGLAGVPLPPQAVSAEAHLLKTAGFVDLRGTDAPPLTLVDADGTETRLRDMRGDPVLLYFWRTDSADARRELPALARLAAGGRVRVIPVSLDGDDAVGVQRVAAAIAPGLRAFVEGVGVGLAKFEARPDPAAWLLDAAGRPVGRSNGPKDWDAPPVGAALEHWATRGRRH